MASRQDPFLKLALERAQSPEVARLLEEIARRAATFADMQDEFAGTILRNREIREGKPVRVTKAQQRTLANCERDAGQSAREMENIVTGMDDVAVLLSALACMDQEIETDEHVLTSFHDDDKPMARRLLDFQRETKRLIEQFMGDPFVPSEMV